MAVYTHLTQDDIAAFLAQYNIGALDSFEGISEGVTNTNYLITVIPSVAGGARVAPVKGGALTAQRSAPDDKKKYILTLFEKRFSLEDLPYFVALMQWWEARGVHCPKPIPMKDGRVLCALRARPAILVSFLEGAGVAARKITLDHMRELGALMAKMHVAGMDFPHRRANGLSLKGWEQIIDAVAGRLDEISPGLKKTVSEEYNYLSENWPQQLPCGPVHADLFPDNVFFEKAFGGKPKLTGVIDFYFSCHDMWAYDLAICVNAWCFDERHRLVPERVQMLMAAYNDRRSFTPEEDAAFPLLLRGAALRFLLTRAQDWLFPDPGAAVTPKDPLEYLAKLQFFQSQKL